MRSSDNDVSTQPHEVKRVLGFLTANTGLYQRLTARELLVYFAQFVTSGHIAYGFWWYFEYCNDGTGNRDVSDGRFLHSW